MNKNTSGESSSDDQSPDRLFGKVPLVHKHDGGLDVEKVISPQLRQVELDSRASNELGTMRQHSRGEITPAIYNDISEEDLIAFLHSVQEAGKSDPERTNASDCLKQLQERESEFIGTDLASRYWGAVSLQQFHLGQGLAKKGEVNQAIEFVAAAIDSHDKSMADVKGVSTSDWGPYLRATLSYLENDSDSLRKLLDQCHCNASVVSRLLDGLLERGNPNYESDY
tara:strand:- start:118 stop:792 length:675 start_codon:yes stop_codon:yes gene_type:complete